jgi:hypothetical protein
VNAYTGTKSRRLDSWKDIAAYLGRDVRTVIRWEKQRALPVHRDNSGPGRTTVYADVEELDRWLMGLSAETETVGAPVPHPVFSPPGPVPVAGLKPFRRFATWILGTFVISAVLFGSYQFSRRTSRPHLQFAPSDFPAAGPMSVGIADFDHDGNLDIVFTNSGSDTVDIVFGNGHGAFLRRISIPNAKQPERLAIADFNGDGNQDLAITHRGSLDVIVLLGNGQGGFRESFRWDSGGRSRWVTASDVNHDGMADLVVACSSAQKVAVLLGRGDGTFDRIREYDTDGESSAVLVGDFTHDGIPDVLTADYRIAGGTTVSIYAGVGDGTLRTRRPFRAGFGPLAAAAADFNQDGLADIVTADFRDGFSILLATADGFSPPRSSKLQSAPGFVATGDFDRDGHIDLLIVAEHSNDAHLYFGNGRGDFPTSQTFGTAAYPDSIAVADLDHDGRLDFVVGAVYGNLVSVYLNRTPRQL